MVSLIKNYRHFKGSSFMTKTGKTVFVNRDFGAKIEADIPTKSGSFIRRLIDKKDLAFKISGNGYYLDSKWIK